MARSFDVYGDWMNHNGKVVLLDGIKHKIKCNAYMARYPREEQVISVFAEPVNKRAKSYQEQRAILKDDFAVDVLDSDIEVQAEILSQLS